MKKLFYVIALGAIMVMASCTGKTEKTAATNDSIDTVNTDTVATDTIAADSTVADSVITNGEI